MKVVSGSHLCTNMEDALVPIRRLLDPATREVVYDCETDGLDWRTCKIVGHVLTFGPAPQDTYYVPVRHGAEHRGNVADAKAVIGHPFDVQLNKISRVRRDLHWVGHNFQFDLMFMHKHGIDVVGEVEDTQVNAALLDEFQRGYSLANCCDIMGTPAKRGEELYAYMAAKLSIPADKSAMGKFWMLDGDDRVGVDYATGDGVATWALWKAQVRAMEAQDLSAIRKLEYQVTRVLYRLKKRGVKIDLGYLQQVRERAERELHEGLELLPSGFNVRGPKQVRELMEKHGHTDWPMTAPSPKFPNGQPSFPEAWLKTAGATGKAIVNVRKWSHLLQSFITPLEERHIYHGRVHPSYYQMASDDFGTSTGRLSCSEPNLQQAPKRNKEVAMLFRPVFIPDDGMEWCDADLAQAEPRILAHYSGAKVLVDGYTSVPSVDAHQAVCDAVNAVGVPIDRESAKRLNQTLITGGGRNKIITMLGARGAEIYDGFFKALPEVKQFQREANDKFTQRGYVISLLGRRARLEHRSKGYLAINRLLQCGNADTAKKGLVDIDAYFEANGDVCNLLNSVHDSASMQNPIGQRDQIMEALRLFTDFGPGRSVPMRVPMACDYGFGPNWGAATFPSEKLTLGNYVA